MGASASTLRRAPVKRRGVRVVRRRTKVLIKRREARRVAPLYIAAAIAVAGIVAGVLLTQVVLAQSAFRLSTINKKLVAAESRQEQLLAEMADLESPGRIERHARTALGMVDPEQVEYVVARVNFPEASRLADAPSGGELPAPGPGTAAEAAP
jgi:cell division protein FtsL